jgi:hypothetical protein
MEYYNNILCISGLELHTVIPTETVKKMIQRGTAIRIRKACNNKPSLIEIESLPANYKTPFRDSIEPDPLALTFFTEYRLNDGRVLPQRNIQEYCNDAAILNSLRKVIYGMQARRTALGSSLKKFWPKAVLAVNNLRNEYPCSLPSSEKRLKERYDAFFSDGYEALISRKFCNDNSRKVTSKIENLILSLYTSTDKPYGTSVHEQYLKFINGQINVFDQESGELFNREDFFKGNAPIEISESTVWNYINNGVNRILVDSKRSGKLEFNSTHRPHHVRKSPEFSFSKVSMDDRDLPRKLHSGLRVKAYYAYDVASGCVIGKSYSKDKDRILFTECVRDMFRLIDTNNFGVPMEVEVEHHLVNNFSDGLMQAGLVFPFVRWCNPGNSQEKRAEHFNRQKKYGVEKKSQIGIGRFYAKLEANRTKTEYGQKDKTFGFDELVADDLQIIKEYNNQLHPNQKKYAGQTRWQVLCANLNPNLSKIDKAVLLKFIGDKTDTTIRRSQYCQVSGCKYQIEDISVLDRLNSNNYEVTAYYLADADGQIPEIYLYQKEVFIGKATKIIAYNEATAEQTDDDRDAYTEQAKYVSHFDKLVKEGKNKLIKTGIIEVNDFEQIDKIEPETVGFIDIKPYDDTLDTEDFEEYYSSENMRKRAIEQL